MYLDKQRLCKLFLMDNIFCEVFTIADLTKWVDLRIQGLSWGWLNILYASMEKESNVFKNCMFWISVINEQSNVILHDSSKKSPFVAISQLTNYWDVLNLI